MPFRKLVIAATLLAVAFTSGARRTTAQTISGNAPSLATALAAIAAAHPGKVALFAEQLNTGREVGIDADTVVQTASTIKLTILMEAMEQVRAGKAHWSEPIMLKPSDGVSGSGILAQMDAPLTLTLKDALTLMIVLSDNTATNLMIDRFGVDAMNARIAWMGLKDTHLYKKIGKPSTESMPADQPKYGLGKTTPREIASVMERIGRCELAGPGEAPQAGDAAICEVALTMLRNQFYRDTIPRYLDTLDSSEQGSAIASKTGSLDAVRADVAIVQGKQGPMVLAIYTYQNADHSWTVDNEGEVAIARLAREIVKAWSPAGLDDASLVPGLGLPPEQAPHALAGSSPH